MIMMRKCFLTDEYVFYAEERAKRPHSFKKINIRHTPKEVCPFCLENEYMTPKRVFATEDNQIRIVPNKYPYLTPSEELFSVHDVVIDTLDHEQRLSMFSYEHMEKLLNVLKYRASELEKDSRLSFVQIFKNQGMDAGASQSHSHWQITGLPVVPTKHIQMLERLENYKKETGKCYFCNLEFDERIIEQNDEIIAFCPYDAKFSYEMHIMPKRHIHNFKYLTDNEIKSLAPILKHCIERLSKIYEGICYNICFYSTPDGMGDDFMHFFIQIIPRIGHMAGFEFSTGSFISSTFPENAAKILRDVEI